MHDILYNTPIYQLILKEGREEEREEGLEKGLLTGRLEALRQTLVNVVLARYPKLVKLAKVQAAIADNPDMLNALIVKLVVTQSASEAKQYLLDFDEDEDDQANGSIQQ
jgi:predicted transposase YdaD